MNPRTVMITILCGMFVAACATVGKKPVSLATEPKTPAEQAVVRNLESMITAFNGHDIDTLMAYYAPDAKIYTRDGIVSRKEWRTRLSESQVTTADMREVKLSTLSSDRVRADVELYTLSSRGIRSRSLFYDFIHREGQWLIIERQLR